MSDESELEDHVLHLVAGAIQGASNDFPSAARRDFPADTDGKTTLATYLRSNQVSDHLAGAVLAELYKRGFRIVET
jgi:hypothetical protein